MTLPDRQHAVYTHELMGTMASIRIIGPGGDGVAARAAVDACFAELDELERVFSTYRDDSDISRIRRGELSVSYADPRVREVFDACKDARTATTGRFDAWQRGWFDPTGFVKGWATELAATHSLAPLVHTPGVEAVGITVGGDMQLYTAPASDWVWRVGITDPLSQGRLVATVELRCGAVATSGTAERGEHIIDPHTGAPAGSVLSATVVADSLTVADLWATTAVVAGYRDLSWITTVHGVRSGLLVAPDGRTRRWVEGVELTTAGPDSGSVLLGSTRPGSVQRGV